MILQLLAVVALSAVARGSSCRGNSTFGCINGYPFNHSILFVCGVQLSNVEPLYQLGVTGCCDVGVPFVLASQYCCYDGVHNDDVGSCVPWTPDFPDNCYCDGTAVEEEAPVKLPVATETGLPDKQLVWPVNNATDACTTANPTFGCINGFPYVFSEQYVCGDWLLQFTTGGCCNGIPYASASQSCCFFNGTYTVVNSKHGCECEAKSCKV